MKNIKITYRMRKNRQTTQACIILPMADAMADLTVAQGADNIITLRSVLSTLAMLQGYQYAKAVSTALAGEGTSYT